MFDGGSARCNFCERETLNVCTWPILKTAVVLTWDFKIGDIVHLKRKGDRRKSSRFSVPILGIGRFESRKRDWRGRPYGGPEKFTMLGYENPPGKFQILFTPLSFWHVDRTRECGAPCCEFHRREPGIGVNYCMDHWNAWSEARKVKGAGE